MDRNTFFELRSGVQFRVDGRGRMVSPSGYTNFSRAEYAEGQRVVYAAFEHEEEQRIEKEVERRVEQRLGSRGGRNNRRRRRW